jgi:hypothetical protein
VPNFTVLSDRQFEHWPSRLVRVLCPPLQSDPYESRTVRVAVSGMEGGGEGLYAAQVLAAGTVVAFYNGVRVPAQSHNPHGDTGYCIFLDWGKVLPFPFPWVKEGEQIDVPEKYQASGAYSATLAHKANHSFNPNCEFTNFCHPCYGLLPALRTTQEVAEGEELSVHYSLNMPVGPSPPLPSLASSPLPRLTGGAGLVPRLLGAGQGIDRTSSLTSLDYISLDGVLKLDFSRFFVFLGIFWIYKFFWGKKYYPEFVVR